MGYAKVIEICQKPNHFSTSFNSTMTRLLCCLHFIWLNLNKTKLLHHKRFFQELEWQHSCSTICSQLAAKTNLKFAGYEDTSKLNSSV